MVSDKSQVQSLLLHSENVSSDFLSGSHAAGRVFSPAAHFGLPFFSISP